MTNINNKILNILLYASFTLLGISSWIHSTFGPLITFDPIVFHLNLGIEGNIGAEPVPLWRLSKYLILGPILLFLLTQVLLKLFNDKYKNTALLLILSTVTIYSLSKHDAASAARSFISNEDYFSQLYHAPIKSEFIPPSQPRNLILIYVESLENSFRQISDHNLLAPLDELPGSTVEKFYQAPGTSWSIAGMVASQCSIPLKPFLGNKAGNLGTQLFLPNATCVSDILADNGYQQIFLVGPDLKFSGMDKFYHTHKFQRMYGRDELRHLLPDAHFGGWGEGPNDDVLLNAAFKIAKEEHQQGRHFNLTIITTDNHFPEGTPSRNCTEKEIAGGYRGTVQCTTKIIRTFLDQIMADPMYKNTDIFIMGDHLFMANGRQLKSFPSDRFIYFKHISASNNLQFARNEMTHFDVAPTILDALGFRNNSTDDFGLGRSLFKPAQHPEDISGRLDKRILNRSQVYDGFWKSVSLPTND
ncbi:MAG: sulfatase-like hydrolase/transferase [Polynucleobacter sp.]